MKNIILYRGNMEQIYWEVWNVMKECITTIYTQVKHMQYTGIGLQIKYLIVLNIFLSLFFLQSCGLQDKSYDIIVEYQVPFADPNPRWNEVDLIDEDEYGRKIFSYKSVGLYTNVFGDYIETLYSNAPVLLYVVVQKNNNRFVYCYEDLCYCYVNSFDNDNSTIIENLKTNNDWGKPFDDKKMTVLSVDMYRDKIVKNSALSIQDETVMLLEQKIGCKINDYYLDTIFLEDATPIFVLREVTNRERYEFEFGKSFVFCISDDKSNVTYLQLSDDIQNWNQEIRDFKISLRLE